MSPFVVWQNEVDRANRAARLMRVGSLAEIPNTRYAFYIFALVVLAMMFAGTGCEGDVRSVTEVVAAEATDMSPMSDDNASIERGRLLWESDPQRSLSEDEEDEILEMLAWFRALPPDARKDVKRYLEYINALNGTGPTFFQTWDWGVSYTTEDGTSTMGPLR